MNLTLDRKYAYMPWDLIDTVVFDLGNVLLTFHPDIIVKDICPDDPVMQERILADCVHSPYWIALDHGIIEQQEAIEDICAGDILFEKAVRHFFEVWLDYKKPIEEGIRTLELCKAHHKKLLLLSNYHENAFETIRKQYDFFSLFDDFIVSGKEKQLKPNPNIYHTLIDRFHLDPERVLFIDDSPVNIERALFEGWQGICFNRTGKLKEFFQL